MLPGPRARSLMHDGCYTLDLYCDAQNKAHAYGEFPHQFHHERGSVCRRQARKWGWTIGKDRDLCPKCSGKRPAPKKPAAG